MRFSALGKKLFIGIDSLTRALTKEPDDNIRIIEERVKSEEICKIFLYIYGCNIFLRMSL